MFGNGRRGDNTGGEHQYREINPETNNPWQNTLDVTQTVRRSPEQVFSLTSPTVTQHSDSLLQGRAPIEQHTIQVLPGETPFRAINRKLKSLYGIDINTLLKTKQDIKGRQQIFDFYDEIAQSQFNTSLFQLEREQRDIPGANRRPRKLRKDVTRSPIPGPPDAAEGASQHPQATDKTAKQRHFHPQPGETIFETVNRAMQKEAGFSLKTILDTKSSLPERQAIFEQYNEKTKQDYGQTLQRILKNRNKRGVDASTSHSSSQDLLEQPAKRARKTQKKSSNNKELHKSVKVATDKSFNELQTLAKNTNRSFEEVYQEQADAHNISTAEETGYHIEEIQTMAKEKGVSFQDLRKQLAAENEKAIEETGYSVYRLRMIEKNSNKDYNQIYREQAKFYQRLRGGVDEDDETSGEELSSEDERDRSQIAESLTALQDQGDQRLTGGSIAESPARAEEASPPSQETGYVHAHTQHLDSPLGPDTSSSSSDHMPRRVPTIEELIQRAQQRKTTMTEPVQPSPFREGRENSDNFLGN